MKNDPTKDPKPIRQLPRDKSRHTMYLYECGYCTKEFSARFSEILAGKVRSCGCLRRSRRAAHTQRELDRLGPSTIKVAGQRFLFNSRLAPSARRAADAKLMKSLGIKDKDILFKAAQAVYQVTPTRTALDVPVTAQSCDTEAQAAPLGVPHSAFSQDAPTASLDKPQTTVINNYVQGDLHMYNAPTHAHNSELTVKKDYRDTETGFWAEGNYFAEFGHCPDEAFDLEKWALMKIAN